MIGSWITLADPAISEMLSRIGFDWICVDMQHSMLSDADMQNHIRNLRGDTKAYVRVKTNDVVEIGKALDAGAHGIIVPQVMRPDDARAAVYSTRPPVRSTGLWRSRGYGMDYPHTPAKVIVQIEHIQSVEKIESIVGVRGVDGFMIGPYDLSASLGQTGDFKSMVYIDAMDIVDKFVLQNKKLSGIHVPQLKNIRQLLEAKYKGYNFLGLGMDATFMWEYADHMLQEIRHA